MAAKKKRGGSKTPSIAKASVKKTSIRAPARSASRGRVSDDMFNVLERISDAVVALDRNWICTYVNGAAAATFGRKREDLIGKHIWSEFPEGVGQPFHLAYEKALETGEPVFIEEYYQPLDRWFANRIHPSADGLTIYFADITDQKRQEAATREVAEDLAITLRSIGDAVFATDREGRIIRMNPAAERLTGWSHVEADARPLGDALRLVGTDTREPLPDLATLALERGEAVELPVDSVLLKRDGSERVVSSTVAPILDTEGVARGVVVVVSDQTTRSTARKALAESEQRLRLALSSANQGIYDFHVPSGAVSVTPEYANQLGEDPETFVETADSWRRRLHPGDVESTEHALREYLAGRTPNYRVQFRLRTRSGEYRWFLSSGRVVARNEDGTPLRMLGIHTDITELKESQHALAEFKSVLDRTLDCVFMFSADDLRFTYLNEGARRQVGYSEEKLLAMTPLAVFPDFDDSTFADLLRPLIDGELSQQAFTTKGRRKDGSRFPVDVTLQLVSGGSFTPRFVAVVRDVTGRTKAEEALREQERRLRTIVDTQPECVKIISSAGQLLDMNAAGLSMLEASSLAEVQSIGLKSFVAPEHWPGFEELHRKVIAGESGQMEYVIVGLHGTRRNLESHAAPFFDPVDGSTSFLAVTRDITASKRMAEDRERLQEQVHAAARMEAVGQLAGGIAHDFNNLLSVINSTAGLALDALQPCDRSRQDLLDIRSAGERAAALTKQLLAFSRSQIFASEPLDINALLRTMQPMLARIIREDIELSLSTSAEPCFVNADRSQLERVVMNLAINARDAMPRGGKLSITTSVQSLNVPLRTASVELAAGQYVTIRFEDSGEGISTEILDRIFEPFFTTKGLGRGTGLGLSSAFGIVVQTGGTITVASKVGDGSIFGIYLPRLANSVGESPEVDTAPDIAQGRETILVVDDEEALVRVAKRVLESAGYNVLTALSGTDALGIAAESSQVIHLLFSDVVMPGMSGPELASKLSESRPDLRVLFSSGYSDDTVLRQAVQDHTADLLSKPYSPLGMRGKVREILDRPTEGS